MCAQLDMCVYVCVHMSCVCVCACSCVYVHACMRACVCVHSEDINDYSHELTSLYAHKSVFYKPRVQLNYYDMVTVVIGNKGKIFYMQTCPDNLCIQPHPHL